MGFINRIPRTSIVSLQNFQGRRFTQESLPDEMRGILVGQPFYVKLLLVVAVTLLWSLSGILAGSLGSNIFLEITLQNDPYWLELLWMLFVIIIGMITTVYKGVIRGFIATFITFLILLVLTIALVSLNWLKTPESTIDHTISNIILISLGITLAGISFISSSLAHAIIYIGFDRYYIIIRKLATILISTTSILAAIFFALFLDFCRQSSNCNGVVISAIFGGVFLALIVAITSRLATRFENKHSEHLNFLRFWAIAVGSWGGTSFYNLDLSGVNFRGANLANTDLRARKLYRTCFQGVTGLERARVDSRYLDLNNPKVQSLLTHGYSEDKGFSQLNLRGTYLQGVDMRHFNLIDTDLTGADLQSADLRGSILVRTQVIGVDFTEANLTGICIEDWSVNSQTCFTNVQCDYIYRKLDDKGEPTDRYPVSRNFEPREFESLYQEVGNVVELIFKEGVNWRAFSFSLQKIQLEDDGLGLELKGFEKRGDRWVVKVTHNESASKQEVEQRLYGMYNEMKNLLATKEQQINRLLGIAADQAEALKSYSKQPFGNSFFIAGSTITNLAGSGQIDYDEAAGQVRSIVASGSNPTQSTSVAQNLLSQLQGQDVATTVDKQIELVQQVILTEAQKDPFFKQFLVQQGHQITGAMPESAIASAIRNAIDQLD